MEPTALITEVSPAPRPGFAALLKPLLLVSLPLYALDQITKYLVWRHIYGGEFVPVIPGWFDLVHVGNTGAAWGMMHNNNGFFIALSLVALVILGVLYRRSALVDPNAPREPLTSSDQKRAPVADPLVRVGFLLLIPGVLGNLTDRIVHGHVVDFLSFDLHVPGANPWPSFNVADSCICVAVGLFLLSSFRDLFRK